MGMELVAVTSGCDWKGKKAGEGPFIGAMW